MYFGFWFVKIWNFIPSPWLISTSLTTTFARGVISSPWGGTWWAEEGAWEVESTSDASSSLLLFASFWLWDLLDAVVEPLLPSSTSERDRLIVGWFWVLLEKKNLFCVYWQNIHLLRANLSTWYYRNYLNYCEPVKQFRFEDDEVK